VDAAITGPWETLLVETDGPVVTVTLNRPDRLNAISPVMLAELRAFWPMYDADPGLRVAVVTGSGERAFCSGADVSSVVDKSRNRTSDFLRENRFTPLQAGLSKPTICAVNGVCAGGGLHFVADCDFTICSDTATFLDPHVSVGQVSAIETTVLSRRVPHGSVMRMMLLGRHERLTAVQAQAIGMVTEVVPAAKLRARAAELAGFVAAGSPAAIAASRKAIWGAMNKPLGDALDYAWVLLRAHGDHHPDAEEGPRAFAERRDPRWREPGSDGP
jgi:enoyl-CoA hydratase/carnithine racemase